MESPPSSSSEILFSAGHTVTAGACHFGPATLDRCSYSALRLYNGTARQVDKESRVLMVGPIPLDWLKKNRKWAKSSQSYLNMLNYGVTNRFLKKRTKRFMKNFLESPFDHVNDSWSEVVAKNDEEEHESEELSEEREHVNQADHESEQASSENLFGVYGSFQSLSPHASTSRLLQQPSLSLRPLDPVSQDAVGEGHSDETMKYNQNSGDLKQHAELPASVFNPNSSFSESSMESFVTAEESFGSRDSIEEGVAHTNPRRANSAAQNSSTSSVDTFRVAISTGTPEHQGNHSGSSEHSDVGELETTGTSSPKARQYMHTIVTNDAAKRIPATFHKINKKTATQTKRYVQFFDNKSRFNRSEKSIRKLDQLRRRGSSIVVSNTNFLRQKQKGEVIMLEKMLVMVKQTPSNYIPPDFNQYEAVDSRIIQRWKEYIVVVRNNGSELNSITVQFYRTRNIAKVEKDEGRPKSSLDLTLEKGFGCNFYSTLDKTIALWSKNMKKDEQRGSLIYIFRTHSSRTALRWFAFFAGISGVTTDRYVSVKVPDLGVNAIVDLPWEKAKKLANKKAEPAVPYHVVAKFYSAPDHLGSYLVHQVMSALYKVDSFREYIETNWKDRLKVGFAWRRYDRLEWLLDIGESELHSLWSMAQTHDIELRPKFPASITIACNDGTIMEEPTPVEGFISRITYWGGGATKTKAFTKRTYLHSHSNLLFFTRPMRAIPPPPDVELGDMTAAHEQRLKNLANRIPLIYEIAPFRVDEVDGQVEWLKENISGSEVEKHDQAALYEMQRRVAMVARSDEFMDMADIKQVKASSEIFRHDGIIDYREIQGSEFDVEFDSGDVLHLKAHNKETRDVWIQQLNQLSKYWKTRKKQDIQRLKNIREINIKSLHVDEDTEPFIGDTITKWEADRSLVDFYTYNVSPQSWSRSIQMSGQLFHKPQRHASFRSYHAVLYHDELVLFTPYHRGMRGGIKPQVNYRRVETIPLADAYVYSGPITSGDLLDRDRSFDQENPGRHALPRVYPDGWKSSEEEVLRCFVLWVGKKRTLLKVSRKGKSSTKLVNRLGVGGTSLVFMTRSRQERDIWVSALNSVIGNVSPEHDNINVF